MGKASEEVTQSKARAPTLLIFRQKIAKYKATWQSHQRLLLLLLLLNINIGFDLEPTSGPHVFPLGSFC